MAVTGAQQRIYEWAFTSWFGPFQASLLFALTYSLLVLMLVSAVHHLAVSHPRENALTQRNRS